MIFEFDDSTKLGRFQMPHRRSLIIKMPQIFQLERYCHTSTSISHGTFEFTSVTSVFIETSIHIYKTHFSIGLLYIVSSLQD